MIVSHEHKFIFLKARKVAGTSFEIALSKYLSDSDIVTPIQRNDEEIRAELGFQGPRNFNYRLVDLLCKNREAKFLGRKIPLKFYNHVPASVARIRLPNEVWTDYRKLSLVRNPWDRAVSLFFWRNRTSNISDFTPYLAQNSRLLDINHANYMIDGKEVIDTYLRYECLEDDIRALERQMPSLSGLWDTFKTISAKSEARDRSFGTAEIFAKNPEANSLVETLNAWEIERFQYRLS